MAAPTGFGTIGRNSYLGPDFFDMDLSSYEERKTQRTRELPQFGFQA